jgi:hypothetical protein
VSARERTLRIGRAPRLLEAVVAEASEPECGGAVVCHPHPQMGGNMDNPVVRTIADALAGLELTVLRFNFGGVGGSEGAYGGGPAEVEDVRAALAALEPLVPAGRPRLVAGYSFGAWAALRAAAAGVDVAHVIAVGPPLAFLDWRFLGELSRPVTFVAGDQDRFCPGGRLAPVAGAPGRCLVTIPGADHFFAGAEERLARAVADAAAPFARIP